VILIDERVGATRSRSDNAKIEELIDEVSADYTIVIGDAQHAAGRRASGLHRGHGIWAS